MKIEELNAQKLKFRKGEIGVNQYKEFAGFVSEITKRSKTNIFKNMINIDIEENGSICHKLRETFQNHEKNQKIARIKKAKIKPNSIQGLNIDSEEAIEQIEKEGKKGLYKLLQKGFDINKRDKKGNTILKLASLYGFEDTVKLILKEGANPNKKDFLGRIPLILPASIGYKKIVEYILTYGGNPYLEDNYGYNIFDRLKEKGNYEMLSFIQNFK